jgi:hypothetical protein
MHALTLHVATRSMLTKLAEQTAPTMDDPDSFARMAKPGDIITTSAAPAVGKGFLGNVGAKVYWAAARYRLGDRTHAAMVTGKGKAVNLLYGKPAEEVPLSEVLRGRDAHIVRPVASRSDRIHAVRLARQTAQEKRMYSGSVGTFAKLMFAPNSGAQRPKDIGENLICSNLITRAYPKLRFVADKAPDMVNPADLTVSTVTRPVAVLHNRNRFDPENRVK